MGGRLTLTGCHGLEKIVYFKTKGDDCRGKSCWLLRFLICRSYRCRRAVLVTSGNDWVSRWNATALLLTNRFFIYFHSPNCICQSTATWPSKFSKRLCIKRSERVGKTRKPKKQNFCWHFWFNSRLLYVSHSWETLLSPMQMWIWSKFSFQLLSKW